MLEVNVNFKDNMKKLLTSILLTLSLNCEAAEILEARAESGKVIFKAEVKNKEVVSIQSYKVAGNTTFIDLKTTGSGKKDIEKSYAVPCYTQYAKIRFDGPYTLVKFPVMYCTTNYKLIGWDYYGRPVYLPVTQCAEYSINW